MLFCVFVGLPYFEECPDNETVLITVPEDASEVDVPILPRGR